MQQPSLYNPPSLARRDHPVTSKLAAAQVSPDLGRLQAYVLACVQRWPDSTANELAAHTDQRDVRKIGRRLNELVKAKAAIVSGARPCRITGRVAQTWRSVK